MPRGLDVATDLVHGRLGTGCLHLCVDMQNLFGPKGPWPVTWTEQVLPGVEELVARHPAQTLFTRFIPAAQPGRAPGLWAGYYRRWSDVTLAEGGRDLVQLMAPLSRFVPPASVLDKHTYSPWTEGHLDALLRGSEIHTLVITGSETDLCVLGTVLGSVDRGYRTILVTDGVCGSCDRTHDAVMTLYRTRFSDQIEAVEMHAVLNAWS